MKYSLPEDAKIKLAELDSFLRKIMEEYNLELFDRSDDESDHYLKIKYKTKLIINNRVAEEISLECYGDVDGYDIDFAIWYNWHSDDWKLPRLECKIFLYENKFSYEDFEKFFKDNNVLTGDEMIIKDIIE